MPKIKVSVNKVRSLLSQPHSKRVDYFDSATPGLCLTIGPRASTWYYFRRVDGKLNRLTLGTDAEFAAEGEARTKGGEPDAVASFTIARERAGEVESAIGAGKHPKAEQARKRSEAKQSRAEDITRLGKAIAKDWREAHFPTLATATQRDYSRELDAFVESFGDQDIGNVRRGALVRHLDPIVKRSPSGANTAAAVIRQLFAFARDRFDLDNNPAIDLKNPGKLKARSRTLDRDEIRLLWHACVKAGYPYGHALRFALCTGQRIGEVGGIKRSDIDSTGEYWIQTENKSDQRIDIALAPLARAILDSCPNFGKDALHFFSARGGKSGIRHDAWVLARKRHIEPGLAKAAEELEIKPIERHWTPHDLRRTVRTALTGWCGVSPDTAERVLNHAISGLRGVYDHADYRPHVAAALRRWDQELSAIIKGEKPTVVSLVVRRAARKRRTG